MRLVSYALATTLLISIAPFDLSYAQSTDCTVTGISAEEAPPPLPDYDQPPIPDSGYIWTPGYWAWNNDDYYWVPGTWVEPPEEGLLWTPPYWGFVNGAYVFHRGYWGPHVGFYGGVDYGYGYGGRGFEGGHWNNGAFYYNRAVTNLQGARITNVYEKTVVINNNRISYNGGQGGLTVRPTAAEEATAREPHHPPTHWQTQHVRAASMNSAGFASTNHGHPAIGATARPIGFEGGDATHKPPREGGPGALEANPVGAGAGHPPLERHEPHAPLAPAEGGKPVHEKPLAHGLETPANGMHGPHKHEQHVEPGMGTPPHAMHMQAAPHAADTTHRQMPPHQAGVPHMEAPMHREAPHREEAIHYGAPGGGGHPPGHEGGKKRPGEP